MAGHGRVLRVIISCNLTISETVTIMFLLQMRKLRNKKFELPDSKFKSLTAAKLQFTKDFSRTKKS